MCWSDRTDNVFGHPAQFGRHRIILHSFSGRRRIGDFQYGFDAMMQERGSRFVVHTVSLDIVVDAVHGNITGTSIRAFWYHGISQGWVLAFLAGPPPCETWARAVQVKDTDRRAPRVVRSGTDLWGLDSLSLRELDQVMMGNTLLCFALGSLLRVAFRGGTGALEHPKDPEEPSLPSIWRLPFVQWLQSLPGFEVIHFSQGLLGASSMKPTSLLCLNLPSIRQSLVQHGLSPDLPKGAAIGKLATGQWATCHLKEYRPAMDTFFKQSVCPPPTQRHNLTRSSFRHL